MQNRFADLHSRYVDVQNRFAGLQSKKADVHSSFAGLQRRAANRQRRSLDMKKMIKQGQGQPLFMHADGAMLKTDTPDPHAGAVQQPGQQAAPHSWSAACGSGCRRCPVQTACSARKLSCIMRKHSRRRLRRGPRLASPPDTCNERGSYWLI